MFQILRLLIGALRDCIMSRGRLEAEVLVLRHQLNILRRQLPRRVRPNAFDRALFCAYRRSPGYRQCRPRSFALKPSFAGTVWVSVRGGVGSLGIAGGRPEVGPKVRYSCAACARKIHYGARPKSTANCSSWVSLSESTVSKYMLRGTKAPSQGWKTFLRNHADGIAAVDFFVNSATLTFERLFAFVILGVGRRNILWIGVTANPTAQWLAHQITEAFPWDTAPTFLIRDNDCAYGEVFTRRVRSMGIRDRPYRASIAMAERICRARNRLDPT